MRPASQTRAAARTHAQYSEINERKLLEQALSLLPEKEERRYHRRSHFLVIAVAAGPARSILRPSEMERSSFHDDLLRLALFGADRIFTPANSTTAAIEDQALVLTPHDDGAGTVRVNGQLSRAATIMSSGESSASRMRARIPTTWVSVRTGVSRYI
jgi:hypothetical protein